MTRKKGSWKKKEEEKFIVLKTLAIRGPKYSIDFEKMDDPIPHASLAKILTELKNRKLIKKIPSKMKSKRGLVIPRFMISLIGLLVWFVNETNNSKFSINTNNFQPIKEILPILSDKWESLRKYYQEDFMIKLLVKVISNLEILASESLILKYKTFYRGVTMEFKNTQEHNHASEILKIIESDEFRKGFETMINFGFFLELYKLHEDESYYYDDKIGLKELSEITDWLRIIKSDEQLTRQITIGFNTMLDFAKRTYEGMKYDNKFIQGKGKKCCVVCAELYDKKDESRHFKSHTYPHDLRKQINKDFLLSRSMYENELEFEKNKIFRFTSVFHV